MNFQQLFEGSDMFYLADPTKTTIKKNGGVRWGVKKEFKMPLTKALEGHLTGTPLKDCYGNTGKKGVVVPPIRKSDNKCRWGAIDVDGNIYKDDNFKRKLLDKIKELDLPIVPCFSKSKGLHLYIRFKEWTDAQKVIDILHTFLHQLGLPDDTECFPKQAIVEDTGNGIMLPYMHGVGNDLVRYWDGKEFLTGSKEEFEEIMSCLDVNAEDIKIELPPKSNGAAKAETKTSTKYTKSQIIKKIKNGTIENCPGMGGKYHGWIQVIIAKAIVEGWEDTKILNLIKEVHEDDRGIGYTWPESYQKMIDYARRKPKIEEHRKELEDENILGELIDEEQKEKLNKIIKKYYYFEDIGEMYDPKTEVSYREKEFNNKHLFEFTGRIGKKHDDKAFAKLLKDPDFQERKLQGRAMLPDEKYSYPVAVVKPGDHPLLTPGRYFNLYEGRPLEPDSGDVSEIIKHFKKIFGEDNWRHLEQYLAYCIRYPGVKTRWIPLVVSVEGVGKGLLLRMMSKLMGYKYVNEDVSFRDITEKHSTIVVGTLFICLNEVVLDKQYSTKRTISSQIKPFITDDFLNINEKGKRIYKYLNICNSIIFSNDKDCIHVDTSSRRFLVIHCKTTAKEVEKMAEAGDFEPLWKMLDEHPEYLLGYFLNEVEIEDEKIYNRRAPKTAELIEMIEDSRHDVIQELDGALREGAPPFAEDHFRGFISLEILMNFMRHKWNTPYPPRKLVKEWLKENSVEWKPGEKARQIVMQNGQRPRVYNLDKGPKGELLKCLTEGQLGQLMSLKTDGHYWENLELDYFMKESVTKDEHFNTYNWKDPKMDQMKQVWFGKEDQTRRALYYLKFMDSEVVNLIIKVKQQLMKEENKLKAKFTKREWRKDMDHWMDALDYIKFNAEYKPLEIKAHKLIDKIIKQKEEERKAHREMIEREKPTTDFIPGGDDYN